MARVRLPISKRVSSPESDRASSGSSTSLKSQPRVSKKRKITEEEQAQEFCNSLLEEEEEFLVPQEEDLLVPSDLYYFIRKAAVLRDHLKTNNTDMDSMLDLESAEGIIRTYAEELKNFKELPQNWKYDPAAVKSYISHETATYLPLEEEEEDDDEDETKGLNRCCAPFKIMRECYAKTDSVPLSRTEEKIWKKFQEFDKNIPGLGAINLYGIEKEKMPIKIDNPIVSLIGNFAIASFNKAIEKSVKQGVHKNLRDFEFMKCTYIKMFQAEYYFYLTIEAIEEGILGVYEAKVRLKWKDGRKSLCSFRLTDRTPRGKMKRVKRIQLTDPDYWLDPMLDKYTGMKRRSESASCMGYDYRTPWGFEGP